jgi:hypothetical protein
MLAATAAMVVVTSTHFPDRANIQLDFRVFLALAHSVTLPHYRPESTATITKK